MSIRNLMHRPKAAMPYAILGLMAILCVLLTLSVGAQPYVAAQATQPSVREETAPSKSDQPTGNSSRQTARTTASEAAAASDPQATTTTAAPAAEVSAAVAHPASYVWTCGKDYGGVAPGDGSLSEWAPHYFIAHSYGPYGQVILSLEAGDTVTVNGSSVTVEGAVIMGQGCAYEDVMNRVGWDATVFQTCVPDSNDCRFVYARGASSTAAAAAEARQWAGQGTGAVVSNERVSVVPDVAPDVVPDVVSNVPSDSGQNVVVGEPTPVRPGVAPQPSMPTAAGPEHNLQQRGTPF